MNRSIHWALAAIAVLALATAIDVPMLAQSENSQPAEPAQSQNEPATEPSQSTQTEGQGPQVVQGLSQEGELKAVDTDERIFLITDESGQEMLFHFDDDTEVVGQTSVAQGLTGHSGTRVRIMYRAEGNMAIAERIELDENVTGQPSEPEPQPTDPNL